MDFPEGSDGHFLFIHVSSNIHTKYSKAIGKTISTKIEILLSWYNIIIQSKDEYISGIQTKDYNYKYLYKRKICDAVWSDKMLKYLTDSYIDLSKIFEMTLLNTFGNKSFNCLEKSNSDMYFIHFNKPTEKTNPYLSIIKKSIKIFEESIFKINLYLLPWDKSDISYSIYPSNSNLLRIFQYLGNINYERVACWLENLNNPPSLFTLTKISIDNQISITQPDKFCRDGIYETLGLPSFIIQKLYKT